MPYSSYKPGQISLIRDYYKDATTEKPDGNASLSNFKRFDSLAGYKMNDVKPQHYLGRGAADSATSRYILYILYIYIIYYIYIYI